MHNHPPFFSKRIDRFVGYAKATHFGPTLLVCTAAFFLAFSQFSVIDSLEITVAIFCGQCTVGWSNDLIDQESDRLANRMNKPLVALKIFPHTLRALIFMSLALAFLFSILGPLGVIGTNIHLLGIGSAMAYNLGLKRTIFSFLPYLISFGAMPWAIYKGNGKSPPLWLYSAFALFTIAFHFLNVIKDMDSDREQSIFGLPQRLGTKNSAVIAGALFLCGAIDVALLR
jgi:4-hydroxybenzoate polyprenyltransferase